MAHAIDRLFATPTMSACFPERSGKLARSLFGPVMLAGGPAAGTGPRRRAMPLRPAAVAGAVRPARAARIGRIFPLRVRESRRARILEPALPARPRDA